MTAFFACRAAFPCARRLKRSSLGEVTLCVREAKARVNHLGIAEECRFVLENARLGRLMRWGMNPFSGCLLVSDWTRFRLYDAKFGGAVNNTAEEEVPRFEPALGCGVMVPYIGACERRPTRKVVGVWRCFLSCEALGVRQLTLRPFPPQRSSTGLRPAPPPPLRLATKNQQTMKG